MPEGDTVWRQARLLSKALLGKVLNSSDFRVPALATLDLGGATVESSDSRGKHLLLTVRRAGSEELIIHSHLKMEGIWQVYLPGERWRRPAHTARVVLKVPDAVVVGFSLGILEVLSPEQAETELAFLGPDLLGTDWDANEAIRRLESDPERPVGIALLDQRNLAGIGNIYRNELCFLVRVRPQHPVGAVSDLPRLVDLAKRLLEANKTRPQRNTTGTAGRVSAWVYGREHQPCLRCGSHIIREEYEGRPIYYCPHCQPAPES
ncbi:endonuclease-8 [Psychromicrobium silvestre]|uniref:DNA-(apurinic or apyrimidinic site) lyase n=1 Tax=Psychromicrobium silvestre TaxID=1645614 RepID=A0A7Y9LUM0_9MICC|nr:endonuclease-8 [Psychromicrobium silvestre]